MGITICVAVPAAPPFLDGLKSNFLFLRQPQSTIEKVLVGLAVGYIAIVVLIPFFNVFIQVSRTIGERDKPFTAYAQALDLS